MDKDGNGILDQSELTDTWLQALFCKAEANGCSRPHIMVMRVKKKRIWDPRFWFIFPLYSHRVGLIGTFCRP